MPRDGDDMAPACSIGVPSDPVVRRAALFLSRQGFIPEIRDVGERYQLVMFRVPGWTFFVEIDPEDEGFWQLGAGFRINRSPKPTEIDLLRVALGTQGATRIAKVAIVEQGRYVEFRVPFVEQGRRPTRDRFDRCVELLRAAAKDFHDRLLLERPVAVA
jgi:hypothetical protein